MSESEQREEAIFHEALQYQNPEWRSAFLDRACGDDRELRLQVLSLLAAHEQAGEFLERLPAPEEKPAPKPDAAGAKPPAPGPGGTALLPAGTEQTGDRLGHYKLLQKIGEGGCGTVYMAEQEEPVRRRVALKIIKLGMDTRNVIARFEAERQALAMMDHPNIARVLDAGATETGRPFFVMELVRGIKITDYCDQNNLSTNERMELVIRVCRAIQHAHQKGIIHRDIKPSNILVTLHDGVPVPKVIDFGIAKATDRRLTDKTLFTEFQAFIGTPAYMSPEQAEMSGLDIDTRSDIYSLGVLLYELLTGKTPFDSVELLAAGLDEMRRTIREREPVRPSTRLSTMLAAELTATARHRQAEAPKLVSLIRGDLDWIVMKCLEKDRTRRYETANGVARDLERHLRSEPVTARPPSRLYRFRKLVRRNKLTFAAVGAVMVTLAVGFGVSTVLYIQKRQAFERACAAELAQASLRQVAEANELTARRIAYASDLNLAQEALRQNNLGRALTLLNRQRPETPAGSPRPKADTLATRHSSLITDLRGWEWRYLWGRCQSDALFTLCQRSDSIYSLATSADGRWLAVGEFGGAISVWDLRARREVTRLVGAGNLTKLAFSPRQPWLAYSANPSPPASVVRIWDAAQLKEVVELPHRRAVRELAFSSDASRLVTWTADPEPELNLWRVPDATLIRSLPTASVASGMGTILAANADLSALAQGTPDGWVRLVNPRNGEERWKVKASEEYITAVALSRDGKLLATGSGFSESDIRLWEVASGREVGRLKGHRSWVGALLFWPEGTRLASASADQTIRLWDTATLEPVGTLKGHQAEVWSLALLPDQTTLFSGAKDGSVLAWDTSNVNRQQAFASVSAPRMEWVFAPDGQSVFAADAAGRIQEWRAPEFQHPRTLAGLGEGNLQPALSGDGRLLAVGHADGKVAIWDRQSQVLVTNLPVSIQAAVPVRFLNRRGILLTSDGGQTVQEWEVRTWAKIRTWNFGGEASRAYTVSSDERTGLRVGYDGSVALLDLETLHSTPGRLDHARLAGVAFSPDGRLFGTASEDGTAKLWRTDTLKEVAVLRGHLLGVHSIAFSPDGRRVATGSNGREAIKLWDVATGQEVLTLEGEGSIFSGVTFSADGTLLGAVNSRGQLHLWRAPSWAEIGSHE
jgi:WD40 repeat protein/serine/threonine protein kinase